LFGARDILIIARLPLRLTVRHIQEGHSPLKFVNLVGATRYLVLAPIVGLAVAAAAMFALGGLGPIFFVIRSIVESSSGHGATILPIFGLLEFVHQFLIGPVLCIEAMGLFQLFIQDVPLPQWMKTESAEDLETNLVASRWLCWRSSSSARCSVAGMRTC
jgi:uncharacterized membrane protein YqhA